MPFISHHSFSVCIGIDDRPWICTAICRYIHDLYVAICDRLTFIYTIWVPSRLVRSNFGSLQVSFSVNVGSIWNICSTRSHSSTKHALDKPTKIWMIILTCGMMRGIIVMGLAWSPRKGRAPSRMIILNILTQAPVIILTHYDGHHSGVRHFHSMWFE